MLARRPIGDVLGTGTLAGAIAGLTAGAIDAIWSWAPAAQFLPRFATHVRFVLYAALSHCLLGLVIGFVATLVLLVLSRATRLGDVMRFLFGYHRERQAADPRETTGGLSVVIAGLPIVAAALDIAYRTTLPFVATRHEMRLVVIVVMASTLGALLVAIPLAFVAARPIEAGLSKLVPKVPLLASVWAPFVAAAVLVGLGVTVWAKLQWETAKILPLRGPVVAVLGGALAIVAWRPAGYAMSKIRALPRWYWQLGVWIAKVGILLLLVLASGRSAAVTKAETAYTGLGGSITHAIRLAFNRHHDLLGAGATGKPFVEDPRFFPVPDSVPKDFNVLLITIDTLRADHLGMYGHTLANGASPSPNLDAMAAQGTRFANGWAHAPSTRYSMPAILSGRLPLDVYYDPNAHTAASWWPGLLPKATTIAEYLQPLGFYTGAITNYEYFDRSRHFDQGFNEYDNEDARLNTGNGPEEAHGSSSKEQSDKAISFVDRHASERWMLWVHYYDPHAAYEPHAEAHTTATDSDQTRYDGEIQFTDLHLGRVIEELKAKGLYDKTVIVVTGDHGEGFGEHGVRFHGFDLYTAQTKVPFVVRVPGLPPHVDTTAAGHVDIMPTLVNLAGGKHSDEMMGRSLVDVIADPKADFPRMVFQQLSSERGEKRGGVDGTCHVIYNVSPDPSLEVYDLTSDPNEELDISDDDACTATREAFVRWYKDSTVKH
jgi:choline-sulfatase